MKKVYKYPTGAEVPKGAKYLTTLVETNSKVRIDKGIIGKRLVWHYFLVEVKE